MAGRNGLLRDPELQKMINFAKKLERYHETGKVDNESYEDKKRTLNLKYDAFRERKMRLLRQERVKLSEELGRLRERLRASDLDEESYAQEASAISPKIVSIDTKMESLESLELSEYLVENVVEVRKGIPRPLKIIIAISAVVTVVVLLFFSGIFLAILSKLPFGLDQWGSMFMIAILVLALMGIVMSSLVLWVSAKLARIKASYFRALEAALSIAVVTFALNTTLIIISIPILLFARFLTPVIFLLRTIVNIAVYLWIIKSFFGTTWKRSAVVSLVPLVIVIVILLLVGLFIIKVIGPIAPPMGSLPQAPEGLPFPMPPGF